MQLFYYVHRLHTFLNSLSLTATLSREFCQKTCFEASWVVFWSLFGHKKLSLTKKLFWNCIFRVHFVIVWNGCKIWSLGMRRIKQLFKVWSLKETQHAWLFFSLSLRLPSSFTFLTLLCIFIMGVFGSMSIAFLPFSLGLLDWRVLILVWFERFLHPAQLDDKVVFGHRNWWHHKHEMGHGSAWVIWSVSGANGLKHP